MNVRVVSVAEYDENGKVQATRAYLNPMELLAQLGVLPAPGGEGAG